MEQGSFDEVMVEQSRVRNEILAKELDRKLKECAELINSQRLAAVNNVSYQYIRAIQNTNGEQKPFPKDMIPSLMTERPDCFMEIVVAWVAEVCGYEKSKKKSPKTPEERLAMIEDRIKECRLVSVFGDIL